jgi:hypothetical protein
MTTVTLPDVNPASVQKFLAGKKTYIGLAIGMAVVAANHFGVLPKEYVPAGLDPSNWVADEYRLLIDAFARAGLAKAGSDNAPSGKPTFPA